MAEEERRGSPHPFRGAIGFLVTGAGVVLAVIGFFLLWAILRTNLLVYSGLLWILAAALMFLGVLLLNSDVRPRRRERSVTGAPGSVGASGATPPNRV